MAHERLRQVQDLFKKLMHFSPIIGVFGHRQVGKSTFTANSAAHYYTLDDRATRERLLADPREFLRTSGTAPVVIDECQVVPDLFPALKERVRTHKKPGQFVLTGSVRFTSRRAIRESLAGRMTSVEMYPLILSELQRVPLPNQLPRLLETESFSKNSISEILASPRATRATHLALEKYLLQGGLPGLCFIREERLRREGLRALHSLILDRDLRMILETRISLESLERWISRIASNSWQPYNASEMKREFGFAHSTQKGLVSALEGIFMIRRLRLSGGRSGEVILMEDQYEERALSQAKLPRLEQVLSAFFRNARAQFQYRLGEVTWFESYWTRSGARVPLVLRGERGVLGIVAINTEGPTLSQTRAMDSFLRAEPGGKGLFLMDQPMAPEVLDKRVLQCSVGAVL